MGNVGPQYVSDLRLDTRLGASSMSIPGKTYKHLSCMAKGQKALLLSSTGNLCQWHKGNAALCT